MHILRHQNQETLVIFMTVPQGTSATHEAFSFVSKVVPAKYFPLMNVTKELNVYSEVLF